MHEGPQAAIATREPASVLERVAREAERWDLGVWWLHHRRGGRHTGLRSHREFVD